MSPFFMFNNMKNSNISSRICELATEITMAVSNGHRPHDNDKFKEHRKELTDLRCKYFGEESSFCKTERKNVR